MSKHDDVPEEFPAWSYGELWRHRVRSQLQDVVTKTLWIESFEQEYEQLVYSEDAILDIATAGRAAYLSAALGALEDQLKKLAHKTDLPSHVVVEISVGAKVYRVCRRFSKWSVTDAGGIEEEHE